MKENSLTLEKARRKQYFARTIKDADNSDNTALLANTLVEVESLLHSLKRAAGGIGLYVYADKMEYM